ncbi:hypothetical protein ANCDUO_26270, partial [Ancylostoma duodenale]
MDDFLAPWVIISDSVDDEAAVVKHLEPLGFYQFRVTARNGFGLGAPSLISRIIQANGRGNTVLEIAYRSIFTISGVPGAPKLPMDALRAEWRFNTVALPQKTSAHQLEGISEESEEDVSRVEPCNAQQLLSEDPTKRFQ